MTGIRKRLFASAALTFALVALLVAPVARSAYTGGSLTYERWFSSAPA